ncbi:NADP-dependent oxidoreductase [Pullulanibacillus sp. KACC 23026]|uniref:NADP-dependent oxidoreductase n=1 Tax=Pullulanibacillus sp. KACC 23026 TaxID=3028315 RepID=UPI0023B0442A|nr:NADP-dependent oxidoreductase [Pullulanibacillus sp. KACC 23026]WEG11836.1 NADP-dependent oxidoreductase [Pullulanibacillus sp. KACC 23026]
MVEAKRILLKERPVGFPNHETFQFETVLVPEPDEGQVRLKALYISVDPYMRGRMSDQKSYVAPYEVGQPITGGVVAEVTATNSDKFQLGDLVLGELAWQTEQLAQDRYLQKLDPTLAPLPTFLGVLGMTGLTAYFGLLDIGDPKDGETVVVSGGAGAVGTAVGQIAKIKGARAVGIAGSEEKCRYLVEELGFDSAVNYKSDTFRDQLKAACPSGVDVYFDNVGGTVSDNVMSLINDGARIPLCGQIALYNNTKLDMGPRIQTLILIHRALMKGFIVSDYRSRFGEGMKELATWVKEGKLTARETVVEGFDAVPDAFLGLFSGENIGKSVVKVADLSSR